VEPLELFDKNMRSQYNDPFLNPQCLVTSFPLSDLEKLDRFKAGEIKLDATAIFTVDKEKGERGLIIIYAKENTSLNELNKLYPEKQIFEFDSQKLERELNEKNFNLVFSDTETITTLDLLKRGGKVVAQKEDIKFIIQLLGDNQYSIQLMGRVR
jgi:hypothetical protein